MNYSSILDQAVAIIKADIDKIIVLAAKTDTLDKVEAGKLTDYVKTLIMLNKDDREKTKLDSLATRTDEELEALAKQAIIHLQSKLEANKETPAEPEPKQAQIEEKEIEDVEPTTSQSQTVPTVGH